MKILKNNFNETDVGKDVKVIKPYPRELVCEQCGSSLEYEESDIRMGALGCVYLDCPLCHYENMLEENENTITLTVNNVEFPTHFFHTSTEGGAVDCCNNEEIKKCIQKAVNYFRENKEAFNWSTQTGNLYICVRRYSDDEDYEVIVTKDYYSTYIPFEPKDY